MSFPILTDTDSISLLFRIICSQENSILDDKFRDIIFEVIVQNNILSRFDTSHEYWQKFNIRNKDLEKKLGYFEIESIGNPCQLVIAVNPKEYYEHFENFSHNKNIRVKKKETSRMNFDNFANRIVTSNQIDNFEA